jgi:uncharacterized protein
MTYLLTGASGFIGKRVAEQILQAGHTLHYLGRKATLADKDRATFFPWSTDAEVPPAAIHLAGEAVAQRWSEEVKRKMYDSRVGGTTRLVQAIAKASLKPSVLVSASAIGYYGERGEEILKESSGPGRDFLAEACVHWESAAEGARDSGVRVVTVRLPIVLGKDGGAFPKMATPFRFGLGGRLGGGQQWMSWAHVSDVVELLLFSAKNQSVDGAVNAAAAHPVRNAEFTRLLAAALKKPALLVVPRFALRLLMGEVADSALQSIRLAPSAAENAGFRFRYSELSQALSELVA